MRHPATTTRIEALEMQLQGARLLTLAFALTEIAASLSYNEHGEFDPEESVAANSAADFVESVKETFRNVLSIEL